MDDLCWTSISPGSAARPSPRGGSQVAVAGGARMLISMVVATHRVGQP
jgi:hypothetical protein